MPRLTPDTARTWWLLLRDVLLFGLGAGIWINALFIEPGAPDPTTLIAGAAAMALPFGLRQDEKKPDG